MQTNHTSKRLWKQPPPIDHTHPRDLTAGELKDWRQAREERFARMKAGQLRARHHGGLNRKEGRKLMSLSRRRFLGKEHRIEHDGLLARAKKSGQLKSEEA